MAYGIRIDFANLPDCAADFDGVSITLDRTLSPEATLFNALHLFGHNVEWATDDGSLREMTRELQNGLPTPLLLERLKTYEMTATSLGIWLLHRVEVFDLDQWASDVWAWDWEYIRGVYTSGMAVCPKRQYQGEAIQYGRPLLVPCPVPEGLVLKKLEQRRRVI